MFSKQCVTEIEFQGFVNQRFSASKIKAKLYFSCKINNGKCIMSDPLLNAYHGNVFSFFERVGMLQLFQQTSGD